MNNTIHSTTVPSILRNAEQPKTDGSDGMTEDCYLMQEKQSSLIHEGGSGMLKVASLNGCFFIPKSGY